ncbi:MAG TPA: polysaccharide biosynthesis protein, partial [Verrucomicrobiae bacterium]|nr:polysaccharide biosynthesis protein [Verrucomicrobiae bacterium]
MNWTRFTFHGLLRGLLLLVAYTAVLTLSWFVAYELRFDFVPPEEFQKQMWQHWIWVLPLKLLFLLLFGQFAGLLSYFSVPDLRRLFFAGFSGSALLVGIRYGNPSYFPAPRGVLLTDFILSFASLSVMRLTLRIVRERYLSPQARGSRRVRRVGIFGAGDVGASLARELLIKRGLGLTPVAFFDDDRRKWHSRMHDIPVVGAPEALLDRRLNLQLEEVIIAMPSAPAKRIGELVKLLQQTHL